MDPDVTDEDTKSILIDDANRIIQFNVAMLGVERNRKQEFGSFQELLDFVPATFSPSRSAGPLFVLTSCFKYNAT